MSANCFFGLRQDDLRQAVPTSKPVRDVMGASLPQSTTLLINILVLLTHVMSHLYNRSLIAWTWIEKALQTMGLFEDTVIIQTGPNHTLAYFDELRVQQLSFVAGDKGLGPFILKRGL